MRQPTGEFGMQQRRALEVGKSLFAPGRPVFQAVSDVHKLRRSRCGVDQRRLKVSQHSHHLRRIGLVRASPPHQIQSRVALQLIGIALTPDLRRPWGIVILEVRQRHGSPRERAASLLQEVDILACRGGIPVIVNQQRVDHIHRNVTGFL